METPIPTPFDIIPPPPGVWIPSALTWALLALCFVLALLWIRRMARQIRPPSIEAIIADLSRTLSLELSRSPLDLERVIRIARRLASQYLGADLTGLTSAELRNFANTTDLNRSKDRVIPRQFIAAIADLEDQAYAPLSQLSNHAMAEHLACLRAFVLPPQERRAQQ